MSSKERKRYYRKKNGAVPAAGKDEAVAFPDRDSPRYTGNPQAGRIRDYHNPLRADLPDSQFPKLQSREMAAQ